MPAFGHSEEGKSSQLAFQNDPRLEGKAVHSARHLGGTHTWNNTEHEEVGKRILAVKRAWAELGSFWTSKCKKSLKRSIFIGNVMERPPAVL